MKSSLILRTRIVRKEKDSKYFMKVHELDNGLFIKEVETGKWVSYEIISVDLLDKLIKLDLRKEVL